MGLKTIFLSAPRNLKERKRYDREVAYLHDRGYHRAQPTKDDNRNIERWERPEHEPVTRA